MIAELNERIDEEFSLVGLVNRMDGSPEQRCLYVERRDDGRLMLCDYNGAVEIEPQDALGGGIEEDARAWLNATS